MRSLPIPSGNNGIILSPKEVFLLCISRVEDPDLAKRYASAADIIAVASIEFDSHAAATTLHEIEQSASVAGLLTNEEMKKAYTERMVPQKSPGRVIYDIIKNAASLNICPLCEIGPVSSLDHQLPKAKYSCLTVTPNNLVPACDWCQGEKKSIAPQSPEEQPIHPYFDNFSPDSWLRADLVESPKAAFIFSVEPPSEWSPLKTERAKNHLKTYNLTELYSIYAGNAISSLAKWIKEIHGKGGADVVKQHMEEEAKKRGGAMWEKATFLAASRNHWFCNGGFEVFMPTSPHK